MYIAPPGHSFTFIAQSDSDTMIFESKQELKNAFCMKEAMYRKALMEDVPVNGYYLDWFEDKKKSNNKDLSC